MTEELKIQAFPQFDPNICNFLLEKPIEAFGIFTFKNKDEAASSEIAKEIFSLNPVSKIIIIGNTITVTKSTEDSWPTLGKEIGQAIRKAFASGNPLLAENLKKRTEDEEKLAQTVRDVIEARINPAISAHGGFIELWDVKDKDIYVKMGGGCQGCAASKATLKDGVAGVLKEEIPDLGEIFDTTDHTAGENPYY